MGTHIGKISIPVPNFKPNKVFDAVSGQLNKAVDSAKRALGVKPPPPRRIGSIALLAGGIIGGLITLFVVGRGPGGR